MNETIELVLKIIIYLFVFCFGMIIGSFLNVCIFRLPKNESLIKRSSHCMTCGEKIKIRDLVPIFSWLFLRGKCRKCGEKISGRYPLVESLNAVLYVFVFMSVPFESLMLDPSAFFYCAITCLFISALIVVGFIDFDTQEMDLWVLLYIALLAVPSFFLTQDFGCSLPQRLIGAVIISVPFLIIGFATGGMGLGDAVLMAGAGLLIGAKAVVVSAFFGILLAAAIGIIDMLLKRKTGKTKIPFGPYLSIALAFGSVYGTRIADWYIEHFLTFE